MSLSNQVKESVDEASKHVRDALAFAARAEESIVLNVLADILARLESLETVDKINERLKNQSKRTFI